MSTLANTHNPIVREAFKDLGNENWSPDITTPRGSLRTACTIQVTDSATVAQNRMHLFYNVLGYNNREKYYAIPIETYQENVRFSPHVTLIFMEKLSDVAEGFQRLKSEISFRLINEDPALFREEDARRLGQKIKSIFAPADRPIRIHKGRTKYNYFDKENGYRLSLLVTSESEGESIVRKVLSVKETPFQEDFVSVSNSKRRYSPVPPLTTVYGKSVRLPRNRPVGYVYFWRAELKIHGLRPDVTLVDYSGARSALVR